MVIGVQQSFKSPKGSHYQDVKPTVSLISSVTWFTSFLWVAMDANWDTPAVL